MAKDKKIFFVGLGNMGHPMANNLIEAGNQLCLFDLEKPKAKLLLEKGATWADTLEEGAKDADVVMTSLPGPPQVQEVILSKSGVLQYMPPHTTLIDTTTSSQPMAIEIANVAKQKNIDYLESPITNAVDAAREGRLAIFVGGEEKTFSEHLPLLKIIGKDIFHVGTHGNGAVMKLITNLLWFVNAAAIGEGLMLGAKSGIPLDVVAKSITASAGNSWVAEHDIPSIFKGHYDPSFSLALCTKDLGLILDIAKSQGIDLKMGKMAGELFTKAQTKYGANAAELHVVKLLEDEVGLYLRPPHGSDKPSNHSSENT